MTTSGPSGSLALLRDTEAILRRSWRAIAARPFSSGLTTVIILGQIGISSAARTRPAARFLVETGYEPLVGRGHWWSPITSLFFTGGGVEFFLVLALVVAVSRIAEGLMGTWKTAVAYVGTGVAGTVFGITTQAVASSHGEMWSHNVTELTTYTVSAALAGSLMSASAFASVLWRRRMRVLTLLVCVMLLLYSGQPEDLYRILAAFIGLALGYAYRPTIKFVTWMRSSHHEVRVLLSAVIAITAVGPAVSLFSTARYGPLAPIGLLLDSDVPDVRDVIDRCQVFNVTHGCVRQIALERINGVGPVLLSIIPLLVLLIVAWGLLRGRRFAVWLGAALNGLLALVAAVYFGFVPFDGQVIPRHPSGHYWEVVLALSASVLLPAALAVILVVLRRAFSVRSAPRAVARYLVFVGFTGLVLAGLYVGLGWLMRDTGFTRTVTVTDLVADVTERFIPVAFLRREIFDFFPATPVGSALYHGVGPVFWGVVTVGAALLMRGTAVAHSAEAAARARALVRLGGDSISFMTTWTGNSYWFDPASASAVAYRALGGVAVTTGAPFGAGDPSAVIGRFARFCDDRGWTPAFYSVDSELSDLFAGMGWESMLVAEESVIDLSEWSMTGKRWQDVRSSVNRAHRAGIRAEWTRAADLPLTTSAQIAEISELWVAEKELPEMGFTLGGIDEIRDPDVRLMIAIDEKGSVHGVTSWLPRYRDGEVVGWTLDFMRRRPGSLNGVMEFLIAEAAARIHADGIACLSLSAAPLAHTAGVERGDSSSMDRILSLLSSSLEPLYGFRSLLAFKQKFQPRHRPLIMAYPDAMALPRIGFALARAYLPNLSVRQVVQLLRRGA